MAEKKKTPRKGSLKKEYFEILLEDIREKFQFLAESLALFPTREEIKSMLAEKADKKDLDLVIRVLAEKPNKEDLEGVRQELKGEIQGVRQELEGEIQEVRRELDKKPDREDLEKIYAVFTNHESRIASLESRAS